MILVAFRGTEVPHFAPNGLLGFFGTVLAAGQDWLIDAKFRLVPFENDVAERGKVHRGFLSARG